MNYFLRKFNNKKTISFLFTHIFTISKILFFVWIQNSTWHIFSTGKTYFSCSTGLLTMDYLIFCLKKVFISTLIIKSVFLGQKFLVYIFFSFSTLKTSFHCVIACIVPGKSVIILFCFSVLTVSFFLWFKILFTSVIFNNLITTCLAVAS